ncbi:hypothetical protein SLEP1_g50105 [Rubroshorea leprosula]|uniref:Uncharacterized protein n=1 Tax=Rubroshorea leprosula TaxID=152421 RepID=A0AAV5M207_9ROSI|nr:hypothetical protein SLEP1_g50105 [Rubroshorea leprosula]
MKGGRQPHPWHPIRQGVIPLTNVGPRAIPTLSKGGPGCCCMPGTTPPCTGDYQGTVNRYLMDFYRWRVAIPSDRKIATIIGLMLIVSSCVDSLSIFGSQ